MSTEHIEPLLFAWLESTRPGLRHCSETPSNLADVLPVVRVNANGGSGDRFQFDKWHVDFDAFAATRDAARTLAQSLHDSVLQELPGAALGSAMVLAVREFAAPSWAPTDDTSLRRFTFAVEIQLHTRSAA